MDSDARGTLSFNEFCRLYWRQVLGVEPGKEAGMAREQQAIPARLSREADAAGDPEGGTQSLPVEEVTYRFTITRRFVYLRDMPEEEQRVQLASTLEYWKDEFRFLGWTIQGTEEL